MNVQVFSFLLHTFFPLMDIAFRLHNGDRHGFLKDVMQFFGCTYICLWSYLPQPSNCLRFLDGLFQEIELQPCSSSSESLAHLLFGEYRQLEFNVDDGLVPGLAHKHNDPCLKLEESQLQTFASADVQRQFYVAARIQTSIFLGSVDGEIELGFSNVSQVDIPIIISNLVPGDVAPNVPMQLPRLPSIKLQPITSFNPDPNPPSSSSSSLRSLSMDSPAECSSLLLNLLQTTPHITEPFMPDIPILQSQHQQTMDSIFANERNLQLPTPEALDEVMKRANLAVLTWPACSSSSVQQHPLEGLPPRYNFPPRYNLNVRSHAFKKYASALSPTARMNRNSSSRQSLLIRSLAFMKKLNLMRLRERMPTTSRPTSSQLHHVISERRRREKLNDSFQALKSLLPPGTKKDKGSVLTTTKDYMCSLKAQVEELTRRNQELEAQHLQTDIEEVATLFSQEERFRVRILRVPESTSEGQIIDLHISTRGGTPLTNIVIGVLEFLKQINNVRVVSMEGNNTQLTASNSINHLSLRLIIEENEWDESGFQEAVERLVSDLAR